MYSYEWDEETGGLLLNSSPLAFSKEPRPVYYKEMDILGFDKYFQYKKEDTFPYMWAEANNYFYRGKKIAKTRGGTLYTAPKLILVEELESNVLDFVDVPAMIEKNKALLESLVQETIRKVYNTYHQYKDKVDVFYVAFSGGKDSIVVLDIVQRTLPHNEFKVLFGDTGMEFPDTYEVVDIISKKCEADNIDFIRSCSDFPPEYTWNKFGSPATVTRWCCSVHKTAPQILALRQYTKKLNFTGMAFIGVRASESVSRSGYDYISLGEKHSGQYNCNPILEWNSAEIYLYIYMRDLTLNEAYKKGNRRVGCLVCPRTAERNEYMCYICYPNEFKKYIKIIRNLYKNNFSTISTLNRFIGNGGWKARKNGRDISINVGYSEKIKKEMLVLQIKNPTADWKIWIKTIGILLNDTSPFQILFQNIQYSFEVKEFSNSTGYEVIVDNTLAKENPTFIKLLKSVFRKAACCIGCRECEADCHNGYIKMENGKVFIDEKCIHCFQCHKVEKGCLVYKSLELPKGGLKMLSNKSLNCYSHHAPKRDWFEQYFTYQNEFDQNHSLGSQMYNFFKRFLRDANLLDENGFSNTAKIINDIGLDSLSSWAIMLTNLAYTPQINWYIKKIKTDETYQKEYTLSLLVSDGAKESWVADIWSSFGRFLELPFSEVGMGYATKEKNRLVSITRTAWQDPDPRVILYSLYKFAEACDGYYQFTLTRLLNHNIGSEGVSPTEIFGIDREEMKKILTGLTINYPEYINATFTLDLDNINLYSEKSSTDVLSLF